MNRRDVIEIMLATLLVGVLLGYTLGLIQQAVWKTRAAEEVKCEAKQQQY